jgi:CyaY protein
VEQTSEAQFNQLVDELMFSIEESIDSSGAELDYENSGGLLTLTCETNGSQIILSRQPSLGEVWLAARSGGFHFKLQDTDQGPRWCNTIDSTPLAEALSQAFQEQAGEQINFDF